MAVVDVFAGMNEPQREAVAHLEGPLLVLAGAGSGKTRVITHRIANLIQHGTRPDRVLAITFTNKAAGEMQERVLRLLGLRTPWITTFHSAGLRILKIEHERLGLEHPFTILDQDDQKRMLKRVVRDLELDGKEFDPRSVSWQISRWKNRMLEPEEVSPGDERDVVIQHCYKRYVELCREECVFDFDDLLLRTVKLLRDDEEVLDKYRERFPYILIDEYQDTNQVQYALVNLLGGHGNVCATGDPDQAIYGWRGADIHNILRFEQDFPGCRTVLLERNYRSTQTVLRAAQSVIEHNTERKDKSLITDNPAGDRIVLITVDDQDDEAMAIAAAVERLHREGRPLSDIAIFYRTNAQSRTLEEWLIRRQVPYRIVGGTRFYDRREVKDLLAYLKLMVNPRDLVSLQRIVNVPRRAIGERTFDVVRDLAYDEGVAVWEVLTDPDLLDRVAVGRASRPLRDFSALLLRIAAMDHGNAGECVRAVLELTDLEEYFLETDEEDGPDRVANLREVLTAAQQFDAGSGSGGLEDFLDHISLLTSEDESGVGEEQVYLMTLHASKGLEFPVVFITGLEQGVMPLVRPNQPCDYEEERRLMYVGITRAMQRLFLSNCVVRTQFGRTTRNAPSMFLGEIPDECIEHRGRTKRPASAAAEIKAGPLYPENAPASRILSGRDPIDGLTRSGMLSTGSALKSAMRSGATAAGTKDIRQEDGERDRSPVALPGDPYAAGDRIVHSAFGPGQVLELRGPPDQRRIFIEFDRVGVKELLIDFVRDRLQRA